MNKFFAVFVALGMLAGCNTVEGIGKDLKRGGEHIEKAAH
jgi:predicted small secreted protein